MFTPGATGLRRRIEQRSTAPVLLVNELPGWVVPIAFVTVMAVGLGVKGWVGAAGLTVLAAFLGWFSYLSWPALPPSGRLLRGSVITAVVALAISQALR
jgi:hypothetical protein